MQVTIVKRFSPYVSRVLTSIITDDIICKWLGINNKIKEYKLLNKEKKQN